MATGAFLTLSDWAKRRDPDGKIGDIAELLAQCNEIFDDMMWREANQALGHTGTVRTGLPKGTWRRAYQGVPYTKSTTAQVTVGVGSLEAYSQIDRAIAELEGDVSGTRLSEDDAHLEGLSQQMSTTIFYGNVATTPEQFTGFGPFFNTVTVATAQNANNVLDAGGTGSSNASIWGICWGERTVFGVYPKGSQSGLVFEDKGDVVPGFDVLGNRFEAYTSYFRWKAGLFIWNWEYVFRIANLDTTTAGLAGPTPPDIFALLSKAVKKWPTSGRRISGITKVDAPDQPSPAIRPALYMNRTVSEYADIQAIRDKNVLLKPTEYAGQPIVEFRGVPMRIVDSLLNSEARVT